MKLSRNKPTPKNYFRWTVKWVNAYSEDTIKTAEEAVVEALGDLEDAIKNVGFGTNHFVVTDNDTGDVVVLSSDVALDRVNQINTIINVDQSITYAPTTTVYVQNEKKKKGKDK